MIDELGELSQTAGELSKTVLYQDVTLGVNIFSIKPKKVGKLENDILKYQKLNYIFSGFYAQTGLTCAMLSQNWDEANQSQIFVNLWGL